jgi:hypothetical protein
MIITKKTLNFLDKNIELCNEIRQCFSCDSSPLVASDGNTKHKIGENNTNNFNV